MHPPLQMSTIWSTRAVAAAWAATAVMLGPFGCGSLIVTQKSVESLEVRRGFTWETHELDGFVIYVEPGSVASQNRDAIADEGRTAREHVLAYLQEPVYEPTVSMFIVDSRDRMKDLVGRRSNGTGYYTSNAVCVVRSDEMRSITTHELLHVVAMNLWDVPERWVNEGMAVDATGAWHGHDPDAVCKVLRDRGELPSLQDLTRRFNGLPGLASYPAAGSFVGYLRNTYGLVTVRQVWDGGRRELLDATGLDLDALEAAWFDVVERADTEGVDYSVR